MFLRVHTTHLLWYSAKWDHDMQNLSMIRRRAHKITYYEKVHVNLGPRLLIILIQIIDRFCISYSIWLNSTKCDFIHSFPSITPSLFSLSLALCPFSLHLFSPK